MKDPWCFNLIGADLRGNGFLAGDSQRTTKASKSMFAQAHYYMLNVWSLLDLFLDLPCLEDTGFDVGYITEVDPLWNDDLLAFLLNPEALLFGNPVLQFSCIADSVAANAGLPLDVLFWCMGSWGSAYPLTGHKGNDYIVEDNAALAAGSFTSSSGSTRSLDTASNVMRADHVAHLDEEPLPPPDHEARRDYTCQPIGRSGLIWAAGKNPPYSAGGNASDNFDWVLDEEETMLHRVFVVKTILVSLLSLCAFAGEPIHGRDLRHSGEGEEGRGRHGPSPERLRGPREAESGRGLQASISPRSSRRRSPCERERIQKEVFGREGVYYKDSKKGSATGGLGTNERIYIFLSSSIPTETLRRYTSAVGALGDRNVRFVMRGFIGGAKYMKPTLALRQGPATRRPGLQSRENHLPRRMTPR